MTAQTLKNALAHELAGRDLLTHPFYLRWQAGELRRGELAAYAEQYLYFEASLPGLLRRLLTTIDDEAGRTLVQQNLADEEGVPAPHVELFRDFAAGAGAAAGATATPKTRGLMATYDALVDAGGAQGLAAVVSYEMQAPAIAATKAKGLREWYGFDDRATRFWDLHATMDTSHADWGFEALARLDAPEPVIVEAARRASDAWWEFLDEREAEGMRPA